MNHSAKLVKLVASIIALAGGIIGSTLSVSFIIHKDRFDIDEYTTRTQELANLPDLPTIQKARPPFDYFKDNNVLALLKEHEQRLTAQSEAISIIKKEISLITPRKPDNEQTFFAVIIGVLSGFFLG